MARIAGVNIPDNKHIVISLRYVYGIGTTTAQALCEAAGIEPSATTGQLRPEPLYSVRPEVAPVPTAGYLRREVSLTLTPLIDLG